MNFLIFFFRFSDFTEQTLLNYGDFIVQQIESFESAAAADEDTILESPALKKLCQVSNVSNWINNDGPRPIKNSWKINFTEFFFWISGRFVTNQIQNRKNTKISKTPNSKTGSGCGLYLRFKQWRRGWWIWSVGFTEKQKFVK